MQSDSVPPVSPEPPLSPADASAPLAPADANAPLAPEPQVALETAPLADARGASPLADGVPQSLDPAYVPYERLSGWISAGIVFALGPIVLGAMLLATEAKPGKLVVVAAIWLVVVALIVTSTLVFPRLRFERARWTLSRAGLEIRRGVVFREITSVPRSRVQHLDVTQGPIQRKFGLATLVVHTAGQQHSEVELAGLPFDVAQALRDDLLVGGAGDGA